MTTTTNRKDETMDAPTVRGALAKAGLDWTVKAEPLIMACDAESRDSLEECRDIPARAIVRSDTQCVLGTVGLDYVPVQNWQKLAIAERLVEDGMATLDRAGSFRGGRKVWLEVNMGIEGEVTRGDVVHQRLLISGSHDGSMSLRIQDSLIRVICENSLQRARAATDGIAIRHTRTAHERLAVVSQLVTAARGRFADALDQWKLLASRRVTERETRAYIKSVFGKSVANTAQRPNLDAGDIMPHMFGGEGRPSGVTADDLGLDTSGDRVTERVMDLVESGRGANMARGTAWGAYNAITEYLTHERGNNPDTRTDSLWFGNGRTLNQRALDYALEMAK